VEEDKMAFIDYLKINDERLPFPDSYDIDLKDIESDNNGETEAGTIQRDIVRIGVVTISVSFSVTPLWLKKLTSFSKERKLKVAYFDTEVLDLKTTEMYITNFKVKLYKDTSFKGLWYVSFTLNEF
jgi:hypothetical protein